MNKTVTDYRPIRTSLDLSGDCVTIYRQPPAIDLNQFVLEFWEYEVDPAVGYLPMQIYPNGCVLLRFNITSLGVEPLIYGPSLRNSMKSLFLPDWIIFGAALRPNMAYHLLGLSLSELSDQRLNMEEIWPKQTEVVCSRIGEAQSFSERVGVFSNFLRNVLRQDVKPSNDFLNVFHDIVTKQEAGSNLDRILKQHRTSGRMMRRHFAKYLGIGPKRMDRLVRIQRGLDLIRRTEGINLAQLSNQLGFSDQAHFTRECQSMVSMTPKRFASVVGHLGDKSLDLWEGVEAYYQELKQSSGADLGRP